MTMRRICTLLSVSCIALAVWLEKAPASPGDLVASCEVEHAMGACGKYGVNWVGVCYGGNCMAGGCGCALQLEIIDGPWLINPATPCNASWICTAPETVDQTKPCVGS